MTSRDYRHQAWASLSGRWGMAILVSIVAGLITGAASFIPCGSLLISGLVGVGMAGVMMSIIRGEDTDLARLFDGCQVNFVNKLFYKNKRPSLKRQPFISGTQLRPFGAEN